MGGQAGYIYIYIVCDHEITQAMLFAVTSF